MDERVLIVTNGVPGEMGVEPPAKGLKGEPAVFSAGSVPATLSPALHLVSHQALAIRGIHRSYL